MAAATMTAPDKLVFAASESRAVGIGGRSMQMLRDNAPQVVSGLKLAADVTLGLSLNPFLMVSSALNITGRVVTLLYGTKDNQRKLAEALKSEQLKAADSAVSKVLSPREYPVESGAGFSALAQIAKMGYGVSQFAAGDKGITPLIVGAGSLYSYMNILLGREAKTETRDNEASLTFTHSQSKTVGVFSHAWQYMKDNPVLVSSVVQTCVAIIGLVGGVMENHGAAFIAAHAIYLVANIMQALLVRKNEFNIEGAQAAKAAQPELPTGEVSLEEKIVRRNQGMQPT